MINRTKGFHHYSILGNDPNRKNNDQNIKVDGKNNDQGDDIEKKTDNHFEKKIDLDVEKKSMDRDEKIFKNHKNKGKFTSFWALKIIKIALIEHGNEITLLRYSRLSELFQ